MKRFVYINDESCRDFYRDNRISNTKYTFWNFIPKNLCEQFRRFMNQYFLLIACLQLWSTITPVSPATTWGPLAIIFIVSASKEAWDDYNRYLSDKKANERRIWVVKDGIRRQVKAQEIHVGNIVWLHENDEIPCDLVLIGTSDPQGICYVETAALDGETDLKTRNIPSICANLSPEQLGKIKQWYLMYPPKGPWYEFLVIPLRFELLCSIMIPISIKVTLDLAKGVYAKFIDCDDQMFDRETSTPAHSANTAISEDLGQVEYILSDKTGTLTENRMIFRRCCISDRLYGDNSGDALKDVRLLNAVSSNDPDVVKFLMVMTLCNTVVPIKSDDGTISYKAQSQDEEALVNAASNLNMVLTSKDSRSAEISFNGSKFYYELLDVLEFTSDRKRMSVVVKEGGSGKFLLLSKGADEAIFPRSCPGQEIKTNLEAVEMYSHLGLRTLCLGWRDLEEGEYKEWSKKFQDASCSLDNRENKIAEVCHSLEQDIHILGITAIEDRLQDGVPETIKLLRNAGINVWMLTGDKQNTAIQIGLLCNLITPESNGQLLSINGKTEDDILRSLDRALVIMKTTPERKDLAFVLDGCALEIILKRSLESFTRLAMLSRTAICCRMTPLQKALLGS